MARKTRTSVKDVPDEFLHLKNYEINAVFSHFESNGIQIPAWARFCFVVRRTAKKSYDVTFYENEQEFYVRYSKVLLIANADTTSFLCFARNMDEPWRNFHPPTLIGLDLKTRLRDEYLSN